MAQGIFDQLSQSVNAEATQQENKAFELKLQSAKLEQEHQNRLSEITAGTASQEQLKAFEAQNSSIPTDQLNKIQSYANQAAQALRDRKPFPSLDASDITHPAAQQYLERVQGGLAHAASQMIPVSIHPINANGHSITNVYDKGGNLVSQQDNGLNSEGSTAVNKAEASFGTYQSGLIRVKSLMQSFITAQSAGKLPGQVANITMEKFMQDNPDVKTYFDQKPLLALKGEVDLTHSARAIAALGHAAGDAYPGATDTAPVAMDKLNNLINIGRDGMDATYQAYGVDPKQQHYPNYNLQNQLQQQKSQGAQSAQGQQNQSRLQRLQASYSASQAQSQ